MKKKIKITLDIDVEFPDVNSKKLDKAIEQSVKEWLKSEENMSRAFGGFDSIVPIWLVDGGAHEEISKTQIKVNIKSSNKVIKNRILLKDVGDIYWNIVK